MKDFDLPSLSLCSFGSPGWPAAKHPRACVIAIWLGALYNSLLGRVEAVDRLGPESKRLEQKEIQFR
jgi:hypothetical protein